MFASRTIRPLHSGDIPRITDYFHALNDQQLRGMGVDPAKLPEVESWQRLIAEDLERPNQDKQFYYVLWQLDGEPIGHSNINKIVYGDHAFMHLHVWRPELRLAGHGLAFVRETVPIYFELFSLNTLFCEPYAGNAAPNRTLPKAGFECVRTYETIPGWINYRQTVNRWQLRRGHRFD